MASACSGGLSLVVAGRLSAKPSLLLGLLGLRLRRHLSLLLLHKPLALEEEVVDLLLLGGGWQLLELSLLYRCQHANYLLCHARVLLWAHSPRPLGDLGLLGLESLLSLELLLRLELLLDRSAAVGTGTRTTSGGVRAGTAAAWSAGTDRDRDAAATTATRRGLLRRAHSGTTTTRSGATTSTATTAAAARVGW